MVKLNFEHYLPNTEAKIGNLRRCINGRTVFVLLPGPSIAELKNYELPDVCYATVNHFWVMEQKFHKMDIVMASAIENDVPSQVHLDFLEREEDNIFISEFAGYHHNHMDYHEYIQKYGNKLLHFVADRTQKAITRPIREYPLHFLAQASFAILVPLIIIGGASRIILFGADGGKVGDYLYIDSWTPSPSSPEHRLDYDRVLFNSTMLQILKNTYRTWGMKEIEILNCSPDSKYEVFRKVSYGEVFNGQG